MYPMYYSISCNVFAYHIIILFDDDGIDWLSILNVAVKNTTIQK